jgi:hypothetical protein
MKVTARPDLAEPFIRKAYEAQEARGSGPGQIGATSLINCLRKAQLKRLGMMPKEEPGTMLIFMIGTALHTIMLGGHELTEIPGEEQLTDTVSVMGFIDALELDALGETDLIPVELKSTRGKPGGRPAPWYLEQMATYCIFRKVRKARLYIVHMIQASVVPYDVEFSDIELAQWKKENKRRSGFVFNPDGTVKPWTEPAPIIEHYEHECRYCAARNAPNPLPEALGGVICAGSKGRGNDAGFFTYDDEDEKGLGF